jgi:hypothetical protein
VDSRSRTIDRSQREDRSGVPEGRRGCRVASHLASLHISAVPRRKLPVVHRCRAQRSSSRTTWTRCFWTARSARISPRGSMNGWRRHSKRRRPVNRAHGFERNSVGPTKLLARTSSCTGSPPKSARAYSRAPGVYRYSRGYHSLLVSEADRRAPQRQLSPRRAPCPRSTLT